MPTLKPQVKSFPANLLKFNSYEKVVSDYTTAYNLIVSKNLALGEPCLVPYYGGLDSSVYYMFAIGALDSSVPSIWTSADSSLVNAIQRNIDSLNTKLDSHITVNDTSYGLLISHIDSSYVGLLTHVTAEDASVLNYINACVSELSSEDSSIINRFENKIDDVSTHLDSSIKNLDSTLRSYIDIKDTSINVHIDSSYTALKSYLDSQDSSIISYVNYHDAELKLNDTSIYNRLNNKIDDASTDVYTVISDIKTDISSLKTYVDNHDSSIIGHIDASYLNLKSYLDSQDSSIVTYINGTAYILSQADVSIYNRLNDKTDDISTNLSVRIKNLDSSVKVADSSLLNYVNESISSTESGLTSYIDTKCSNLGTSIIEAYNAGVRYTDSEISEVQTEYRASDANIYKYIDSSVNTLRTYTNRHFDTVDSSISLLTETKVDKYTHSLVNYTISADSASVVQLYLDPSTFNLTINLVSADSSLLSSSTVNLPMASMIVDATYSNGNIIFTLSNGKTLTVPVSGLVNGLVKTDFTIAGIDMTDNITKEELRTALDVPTVDPIPDDIINALN